MRKPLWLLVLLMSISAFAHAQTAQIKGTLKDTAEQKKLTNAVVAFTRKSDSTLAAFTRTDKEGNFTIPTLPFGKYGVLITFPKYADFADDIILDKELVDMGSIILTQKSVLLKEVIIKSGAAIRIKGDTTEYNADSFVVKEGATVEDLLKKLPGMQVNSKGEITAQGQRVQKVLVDGEEFFGDDPTMATQNISARAVDKVQVFDTKTEQQQLTGITTGAEGKTVNIKLKENKKKGAFGKAEAGSNFDNLVNAKLLYNKFVGKKKISLYGTKSNITTGSLSWEEKDKMGIDNDYDYDEINGYYYSFGSSDDFSEWSLRGLPDAYTAGGLYINKWNADKQSINSSYRYNRLGTTNEVSVLNQNILPDTIFYSNRFTKTNGLTQQHAANVKYEWKLDSLTSFKFSTGITHKETEAYNNTASEFLSEEYDTVNTSNRINITNATKLQNNNQLVYRQVFKKPNRLLMTTLRLGIIKDDQENFMDASNRFFKNGIVDSSEKIDQQKIIDGSSITAGGKITYSEPLTQKWTLITDYSYNNNNATSNFNTYDKGTNGKYEVLNPIYSNNFDMDVFSHGGNVVARYIGKKLRTSFGSGISTVQLNLTNKDLNKQSKFNFLNFTPTGSIGYNIKPQTRLNLSYQGSTQQPTLNQLQPVRDNNDPLNIFVGNPNLDVAFNHNFNLFYNSYKVLKQRGIWISASYNLINNAITNNSRFDNATGKRMYSPVNIDGNSTWRYWAGWNKGQGEKKWIHSIRTNGNGGRNITFVNDRQSNNDYQSFTFNYGISYQVEKKYSIDLSPEITYNTSKSSLRPDVKNNYYSYGGRAEGFIMLPGKLELNSDVNFDLRQKINAFATNTNIIYWNATLAKKVLKDKSGKILIVANDILDQNKGFNRVINSSMITEERFQRISRYFLLKFEWSFNKMPGATK